MNGVESAVRAGAQTASRWVGFGKSTDQRAHEAGAEAARAAVDQDDAKLLLVFAAETYDLEALTRGIAEAAPDVPMLGCTTAGEIATDGPGDASVVVMALGGPGLSVATAAVAN